MLIADHGDILPRRLTPRQVDTHQRFLHDMPGREEELPGRGLSHRIHNPLAGTGRSGACDLREVPTNTHCPGRRPSP